MAEVALLVLKVLAGLFALAYGIYASVHPNLGRIKKGRLHLTRRGRIGVGLATTAFLITTAVDITRDIRQSRQRDADEIRNRAILDEERGRISDLDLTIYVDLPPDDELSRIANSNRQLNPYWENLKGVSDIRVSGDQGMTIASSIGTIELSRIAPMFALWPASECSIAPQTSLLFFDATTHSTLKTTRSKDRQGQSKGTSESIQATNVKPELYGRVGLDNLRNGCIRFRLVWAESSENPFQLRSLMGFQDSVFAAIHPPQVTFDFGNGRVVTVYRNEWSVAKDPLDNTFVQGYATTASVWIARFPSNWPWDPPNQK